MHPLLKATCIVAAAIVCVIIALLTEGRSGAGWFVFALIFILSAD
ncbi:MAG: hypothetical protein QM680_01000 [Luteolibacter sp.]